MYMTRVRVSYECKQGEQEGEQQRYKINLCLRTNDSAEVKGMLNLLREGVEVELLGVDDGQTT